MPTKDWTVWVHDVIEAINKIEKYLDGTDFGEFKKNTMMSEAVLLNFQIIGEASKQIPQEIQEKYPTIPWPEMKTIRNIIAHEYFRVDLDTIWETANNELPPLKEQFELLLEQEKKA